MSQLRERRQNLDAAGSQSVAAHQILADDHQPDQAQLSPASQAQPDPGMPSATAGPAAEQRPEYKPGAAVLGMMRLAVRETVYIGIIAVLAVWATQAYFSRFTPDKASNQLTCIGPASAPHTLTSFIGRSRRNVSVSAHGHDQLLICRLRRACIVVPSLLLDYQQSVKHAAPTAQQMIPPGSCLAGAVPGGAAGEARRRQHEQGVHGRAGDHVRRHQRLGPLWCAAIQRWRSWPLCVPNADWRGDPGHCILSIAAVLSLLPDRFATGCRTSVQRVAWHDMRIGCTTTAHHA